MDIAGLTTAFTLIFLAEMGDKTQLTTIMLSSKASAISVFTGSMLAFFLVDGLSALLGGTLLSLLPHKWVSLGSGLAFLIFGTLSFIHRNEKIKIEKGKATFVKAFSMISLMELGDKTQLASVCLAAELNSPLTVLVGVMLGFFAVSGIGVFFGAKILKLLPEKYLRMGTSLLFLFFGFVFILNAITDVTLLLDGAIQQKGYSIYR